MANKSFNPVKRFVSAEYSKTNGDSGAAGDVTPKKTSFIPGGAIITDVVIHCTKAVTSSSGTIKIKGGGRELTGDILSSNALTINTVAQPAFSSSATAKKATDAGGTIDVVITGTITAGDITIHVGYMEATHHA
tara:strand:- start:11 stop:412 length:402 start_codon:yes stop_codon:yes gene_type:complete